jgi:NADH-quinone oxidoreductase subunit J
MSAVVLASEIQVAQNIGFGIIAAIMVVGALKVVTSSNVVHAALALVLVLAGAAAQYLLLAAEFVAATRAASTAARFSRTKCRATASRKAGRPNGGP